ncbi:MAG: DUF362 domain-containing protein [Bryobacteraceae bacterium]|nr:DUF362 domain-containing protein [Bryobacteraceae bacterium]
MHLLTGEAKNRGENYRPESRRAWMERMLAMAAVAPTFCQSLALGNSTSSKSEATKFSLPGLFPGKVVSVEQGNSIVNGVYQKEPVRQMMRQGMQSLTGAADYVESWKMFFSPGERVGIKLNPVSRPYVMSDPSVVHEIVAGLEAAGIKRKDIVVYDRYKQEFLEAGFDKWLPEGVRWSFAAQAYDGVQQGIDGYDPDHYLDMQLTMPGFDFKNERARRSYASRYITTEVDKLVNLCLLKHHQSAGITIALKNLSHGLVNNVCRSHSSPMLNACGAFIPAAVSVPVIRNKTVLNICDGIKGLYHGGPGVSPRKAKYVWEHKTLYFSTDPVAMDRIGWKALDAKRLSVGMALIADAKPDADSGFVRMQPEHVDIAGALGLGVGDMDKIQHVRLKA